MKNEITYSNVLRKMKDVLAQSQTDTMYMQKYTPYNQFCLVDGVRDAFVLDAELYEDSDESALGFVHRETI